jgi:hypothetical protein
VRLGDMTIDRVAQRVRDRVDLLRPSSGCWRAVPLRELVAQGHCRRRICQGTAPTSVAVSLDLCERFVAEGT